MSKEKEWNKYRIVFCVLLSVILVLNCTNGVDGVETVFQTGDVLSSPGVPTDFIVIAVSSTQIDISWSPPEPDTNIAGYRIYRDGVYLSFENSGISFSDRGLNAGTTYNYQVSSYDSNGDESERTSSLSATTFSSVSTLAVPEDIIAIAVSPHQINLSWSAPVNDDNKGYNIYRGGDYLKSVTTGTAASDENLNANTSYSYQISAYDVDDNESELSEPVFVTTPVELPSHKLTVLISGSGQGVVTSMPAGINSSLEDSFSYTEGTFVTLTATPENYLFYFDSWSGVDNSTGNTATVTMDMDKTVTATFSPVVTAGSYSLNLPATDSDGNYTLEWDYSGMLAKSNWRIFEDTDSSFSNPTTYVSYDTTKPYSYTFSNKSDGVYYYQVESSDWVSITVARPQTAVLRVFNNTHYDMIDLRLDGQQNLSYPYCISAGGSADFILEKSGSVDINQGVGFYNSDKSRDLWFIQTGSITVYTGQVTSLNFKNPTISQLLTNFSSSRYWNGYYFDSNFGYHTAQFLFDQSGSWKFYNDGNWVGSGTISLISWNDYASIVTFGLNNGEEEINVAYPFGSFMYENGPASWPVIEYIAD